MKIVYCILNTWYSGGLTRVLANKANYLADHGHQVTIITTDQLSYGHCYPMSDKITFIDLNIRYLGFDEKSLLGKLYHVPKRIWRHRQRLAHVLREMKADIVISMFGKELFILPSIADGSKKILEAHSSQFTWVDSRKGRGIIGRLQTLLDSLMIRCFDKFVVLTNEDKPEWGRLRNIAVISNANTFEPEQTSGLMSKKVIAAGRYGYQKNFEELIQAWQHVYKRCPAWSLHIYGGGVVNDQLKGEIARLGLEQVVFLHDSTDKIDQVYLDASIYVLSSRYEGLGMVLLEAQAYGIPLVSYACKCGPRDIIDEGENGFLIPQGDSKGLADAIVKLALDQPLREAMGKKAKIYSKMFSQDKIMQQWDSLFIELTGKDNKMN